jgi:hypothetical protein
MLTYHLRDAVDDSIFKNSDYVYYPMCARLCQAANITWSCRRRRRDWSIFAARRNSGAGESPALKRVAPVERPIGLTSESQDAFCCDAKIRAGR